MIINNFGKLIIYLGDEKIVDKTIDEIEKRKFEKNGSWEVRI